MQGGLAGAVDAVIDENVDHLDKNENGWTPLHFAAREGNSKITAFLIAKGADVNIRDKRGRTPLARAELEEHDEVADLISQAGGKRR